METTVPCDKTAMTVLLDVAWMRVMGPMPEGYVKCAVDRGLLVLTGASMVTPHRIPPEASYKKLINSLFNPTGSPTV